MVDLDRLIKHPDLNRDKAMLAELETEANPVLIERITIFTLVSQDFEIAELSANSRSTG